MEAGGGRSKPKAKVALGVVLRYRPIGMVVADVHEHRRTNYIVAIMLRHPPRYNIDCI